MSEKDLERLLIMFTDFIVGEGDFSPKGVEASFAKFIESIEIHKPKPVAKAVAPANSNSSSYVKTTLQEAIEQAKKTVHIPVFKNKWGHWESTVYKGLLFDNPKEDPEKSFAFGDQGEDGTIHPLSMNQLLVCRSNGWRYLKDNTIGSAKACDSELTISIKE